jgi:hypothetical protein
MGIEWAVRAIKKIWAQSKAHCVYLRMIRTYDDV